jgi:hypothetical protein
LFISKDEDSPLKATDFGLSVFYKPGDVFEDIVGSAYYVASTYLNKNQYQHYEFKEEYATEKKILSKL